MIHCPISLPAMAISESPSAIEKFSLSFQYATCLTHSSVKSYILDNQHKLGLGI